MQNTQIPFEFGNILDHSCVWFNNQKTICMMNTKALP